LEHQFVSFPKIIYEVGQFAIADFYNIDIDKICTNGIHYFLTLEAAFYYHYYPRNGLTKAYLENGQIEFEMNLKNTIQDGISKCYSNGKLEYSIQYKDGLLHGFAIRYCLKTNQIISEKHYINGVELSNHVNLISN
jgi:antitoxin component YwqK of YwqJK toxin-antitoxin module